LSVAFVVESGECVFTEIFWWQLVHVMNGYMTRAVLMLWCGQAGDPLIKAQIQARYLEKYQMDSEKTEATKNEVVSVSTSVIFVNENENGKKTRK